MYIKSIYKSIIAFFIIIIFFISCSENNENVSAEAPKNIKTIISLSPAITEILIDLNVSDKIIGCDSYSKDILIRYNKQKYENIQSFDLGSPDAEKIVFLKLTLLL